MLLNTLEHTRHPSPRPTAENDGAPNITRAFGDQHRIGRHRHSSSPSSRQTTRTSQKTRLPEVPPDLEKLQAALRPEQRANVKPGDARRQGTGGCLPEPCGNPGVAGGHLSARTVSAVMITPRIPSACQGLGRRLSHSLVAWHPDWELACQALGEPQV